MEVLGYHRDSTCVDTYLEERSTTYRPPVRTLPDFMRLNVLQSPWKL